MTGLHGSSEATDAAHRLHELCSNMATAAHAMVVDGMRGVKAPWFKTASAIPNELKLGSYAELNGHFMMLCSQVVLGVEQLEVKKESVRQGWISAVRTAQSIFDAGQFGLDTASVLNRCFPPHVLATLDTISERFQASDMVESPRETLSEAIDAMRDAIEECEKSHRIPTQLMRVLRHLVLQMEIALANYEVTGESGFWSVYKEAYATFVKVHPFMAGSAEEVSLSEKLLKVRGYVVDATSVGASLTTIGQAAMLMLPK